MLKLRESGSHSTHYEYQPSVHCDLDEANGYDFTNRGFTDHLDNPIEGYAYVASESYPYIMPKYAGIPMPLEKYSGAIDKITTTSVLLAVAPSYRCHQQLRLKLPATIVETTLCQRLKRLPCDSSACSCLKSKEYRKLGVRKDIVTIEKIVFY